jgi:hypothetical protein
VHRGRVMRKMKADSLADLVRMSTRLESLGHFQTGNEISTPPSTILPNRQTQGSWTSRDSLANMDPPCSNKSTSSRPNRVGSLSYVNNGTTSQARLRFAQRGA